MRLSTLSILLVLSTAAHGAMVMPPDMNTASDFRRFAAELRAEMPSLVVQRARLGEPLETWAAKIDTLADQLRADPGFQRMAAERPDLMSFEFYSYAEKKISRDSVKPEFVAKVQEYFAAQYAGLHEQGDERFLAALRSRIQALAEAAAVRPVPALIAGLGMTFPPPQRREILARKSLEERAIALREALAAISDQELQSTFQSERFGTARAEVTTAKALQMLDEAVARELELAMAISLLEVYENGNLKDIDSEDITWFTGDDMGGLETGIPQGLVERIRSQARDSYALAGEETTIRQPITRLIVKEMPPHLAVFRGCMGGDCSTSSSWSFPFSPMERYYFVYEPGNEITEVGYVSGAITDVKGKKTFFLRDITGSKMSPAHVDLIMEGFANLLPQLGVKQMTVASHEFVAKENGNASVRARYNELADGFQSVNQTFNDTVLRLKYLNKASSATYDSPRRHWLARLYKASQRNPNVAQVAVNILDRDANRDINSGSIEEKIQLLQVAFLANLQYFVKVALPGFEDWKGLYSTFKNRDRLKLKKYYQKVERYLRKFGIPLNKRTLLTAPELFYQGHMNAPDAFTGENAEESFQMVVDRYMATREISSLDRPRMKKAEFFASRAFQGMVQEILNRERPIDKDRINQLWRFGFHFDLEMSEKQRQFLLASLEPYPLIRTQRSALDMIEFLVANGRTDKITPQHLRNLTYAMLGYGWMRPYESMRILMVLTHFRIRNREIMAYVLRTWSNMHKPPEQRFLAAAVMLKSGIHARSEYGVRAYGYLLKNLENEDIPKEARERAKQILEEVGEGTLAEQDARLERFLSSRNGAVFMDECARRVSQ